MGHISGQSRSLEEAEDDKELFENEIVIEFEKDDFVTFIFMGYNVVHTISIKINRTG